MPNLDNQTLLLTFIGLVALAMVVQAIILLAAFIAMRKAVRSADEKFEELRDAVMPLVDKTRDLLTRLAPKLEQTTDDAAALTKSLREQSGDVLQAANEVITRVRTQTARLDTLLTNVLDAVERAGGFMADTVAKPMRQISSILASAKSAVESLRTPAPPTHSHLSQGSDPGEPYF